MRGNRVSLLSILSVLAGALGSGCATYATVRSTQPAPYSLGSARTFVLVEGTGRRTLREELVAEMTKQLRQTGWWTVVNRLEEGIRIVPQGDRAAAEPVGPADGAIFVKLDVYESSVDADTREEKYKDRDGQERTRSVPIYRGRVTFGVTTVDSQGRARLTEREFSGEAEVPRDQGRDEAVRAAGVQAAASIVKAITPAFVQERVRVDDDAKDQKPIVQLIEQGAYASAAERLRAMFEREPSRGDVAYNLAVVTEAQGDYAAACELYDKALTLGRKSYYESARASCARRLEGQRAISE
jgi:hypothetical protein